MSEAMEALVHEEPWFFLTMDPTVLVDDRPVPAATVLLHRVCDNDPMKFEEAARIIRLFIEYESNRLTKRK